MEWIILAGVLLLFVSLVVFFTVSAVLIRRDMNARFDRIAQQLAADAQSLVRHLQV